MHSMRPVPSSSVNLRCSRPSACGFGPSMPTTTPITSTLLTGWLKSHTQSPFGVASASSARCAESSFASQFASGSRPQCRR
eukprot:4745566-Prymnesium_polylepis.2